MSTVTTKKEWRPVLNGGSVAAAQESITAIITDVESLLSLDVEPRLFCESALLLSYVSLVEPSGDWDERAIRYLNVAIDKISSAGDTHPLYLSGGLYGGLAQFGWYMSHITRLLCLGNDLCAEGEESRSPDEDPAGEIDAAILRELETDSWTSPYDLISGLVGLGVYFLARLPRPTAVRGITLILNHLESGARSVAPGISWFSNPELLPAWQLERCPSGYYNLGVAHGIPGVIAFLAELVAASLETQRASVLLEGALRWLLAQERAPDALYRFSSWTVPGVEPEDSRLGWCYGDLGIAAILFSTADRLGRADLRSEALKLFDHCLSIPEDKAYIRDASLCHGAIGVGHIFNRLYQSDGSERYRCAANSWIQTGLSMRSPGRGAGGFLSYVQEESPPWKSDHSFLSGSIGIALALLAAIHPIEPAWDALLLLSGCQPHLTYGGSSGDH